MAKKFVLTVLLANLVTSNCQLGELTEDNTDDQTTNGGNPSYSFSYGVSDARTGDIKTVWETKEGDTVKGHYSVMEPDGSMRTVKYSAAPDTGFKAVVNSESATPKAIGSARSIIEEKAMRDYEKYYDYSEDEEDYIDRRRTRRPHDQHAEHSRRKPQYPDLEPSEYTHSISIKHPYDDSISNSESHSHVGYSFDPNCKTKHKKESHEHRDNSYGNFAELDLNKHKYPAIFSPDPFKESYNSFAEPSGFDSEKPVKFSYNDDFKKTKFDDMNIKPASSMKYNYPVLPELSPPDRYENDDYHPPRPKKKRPHKQPDYHYSGEDNDEYVLVPKKKYKPTRPVESSDYRPDVDDDYERPHYNDEDDHDDRYRSPPRNSKPKEVVRKIVKKRRPPVINLLDIFDI